VTYSFADVAERLMARFEGRVPLDMVVRVAREIESSLSERVHGVELEERVEELARARLAELVAAGEVDEETEVLPAPRTSP
jgi:hypothetical protein